MEIENYPAAYMINWKQHKKGTAAEKSAFVPVFSIVFERTERYFCGILQMPSRDGGISLLLS